MLLSKTDKAHAALAERSPGLSIIERRALIVSNGQRSLDEVAGMLGQDAPAAIDRLLRDGYLAASGSRRSPLDSAVSILRNARHAVTQDRSAQEHAVTQAAAQPPAAPVSAPGATASGASTSTRSRRSLAAAKMYVIGLLQLLRNADAAALAAELQAARDPDGMVGSMLDALRHIHANCSPSYAQRVSDRLAEILPEEYLPAVQTGGMQWQSAGT